MAPTAVEILSRDRILLKGEMKKSLRNRRKEQKDQALYGPWEGLFDPIMYRDMEVVIRNYKANRSGKQLYFFLCSEFGMCVYLVYAYVCVCVVDSVS